MDFIIPLEPMVGNDISERERREEKWPDNKVRPRKGKNLSEL